LAIVLMRRWLQWPFQFPIYKMSKKGPFGEILGAFWIFCMECRRSLLIPVDPWCGLYKTYCRGSFLAPVCPWSQPATGPDGVPSLDLDNCAFAFALHLCMLFNRSLELNVNKCKWITFTRLRHPVVFSYMLGGIVLDRVDSITDLGATIIRMLFARHIGNTIEKVLTILGFEKRLSGELKDPYVF
jgi:hypothetical protein